MELYEELFEKFDSAEEAEEFAVKFYLFAMANRDDVVEDLKEEYIMGNFHRHLLNVAEELSEE